MLVARRLASKETHDKWLSNICHAASASSVYILSRSGSVFVNTVLCVEFVAMHFPGFFVEMFNVPRKRSGVGLYNRNKME